MINIGIIGNGFVGKATQLLLCENINIIAYDKNPNLCNPTNTTLQDLLICDIIFISVPTPMKSNGECYLGIIESVLNDLKKIKYDKFVVLRSTVSPGTSDKFNCYFMPEFLTEKNFKYDFINNTDWIFGLKKDNGKNSEFKSLTTKIINYSYKHKKIKYNSIHFVSNKEAEMIKLFRNCFLATKVSFCNEIYKICNGFNINYDNMIKLAAKDKRILHSHTNVPGPDEKFGFGGTCFPKDINNLRHESKKMGVECGILDSVIKRNETIDRSEKDWKLNKGRAVV